MRTALPVIGGVTIRGKRVEMRGYTLEQLVCVAFRIRTRQLIGPAWLSGKRFDVEALSRRRRRMITRTRCCRRCFKNDLDSGYIPALGSKQAIC